MATRRKRPPVKFTESQAATLARFEVDFSQAEKTRLTDEIRWRQELIERYQAEIDAIQEKLAPPADGA